MITGSIDIKSNHIFPEEFTHGVIDNYVHEIHSVEVYKFNFHYESQISSLITDWTLSEVGIWVRTHAVSKIRYNSTLDPISLFAVCSVRARLLGKDATYFNLKWKNYGTKNLV
jgi:hypothetical protein